MHKRLTKSTDNIVITGTLGGIAEYFNIDPTLVRVIFVILSLFTFGSPVLLYILLAVIIPSGKKNGHKKNYNSHPYEYNKPKKQPRKEVRDTSDDDWSDF